MTDLPVIRELRVDPTIMARIGRHEAYAGMFELTGITLPLTSTKNGMIFDRYSRHVFDIPYGRDREPVEAGKRALLIVQTINAAGGYGS